MCTRAWYPVVLLVLGLAPLMVYADPVATAEIVGAGGNSHKITLTQSLANVGFSFDVYVQTDFNATSAQMVIESLDGPGIFNLTGVTFDTSAGWGYMGFPETVMDGETDTHLFATPDPMSNAGNSSDLFGSLTIGDYLAGGSPTRFMTVSAVLLGGVAQGSYFLNLGSITVGDDSFSEIAGTAGTPFEVEVVAVPAPTAAWLGGIGLLAACWMRRRSEVFRPELQF